jgi:hypothetical protein
VIVLPEVASDGRPRFLQALVLADPDFLLLQAAVEPFDVAACLPQAGCPPGGGRRYGGG